MMEDYHSHCNEKSLQSDLSERWPPVCARVRDPAIYKKNYFELKRKNLSKVNVGKWKFNWINSDSGKSMALSMGLSDVNSIPACDARLAFLADGIKSFPSLYEEEIEFISEFISSLIWLVPENDNANNGSASFYELPHVTFVSDATLFFVPPFHQLPRKFGFLGFVENLYHEALHHQVHTFIAFHGNQYCREGEDNFLLDLPQRQDRTFSYTQAFNACYVYGEIANYRLRVAQYLSDKYPEDELTWINEAVNSANMMRFTLTEKLYEICDSFIPPWNDMIKKWHLEKNNQLSEIRRGHND